MQSDEALHERIRQGDLAAFDVLYARYERPLFAFVLRMLQDRSESEDVLHEAFMEVLRSHRARFERGGGFRAWLYQVARNLCLNRLRARQRGSAAVQRLPEPLPEPPPGSELDRSETTAALRAAVDRLPSTLAEVYHLRVAGLSYEEMAHTLRIPLGTVKSRMHETVSQLRKEMESWSAS